MSVRSLSRKGSRNWLKRAACDCAISWEDTRAMTVQKRRDVVSCMTAIEMLGLSTGKWG
jgi:hypothetical protein